jgi:hypothetical protein
MDHLHDHSEHESTKSHTFRLKWNVRNQLPAVFPACLLRASRNDAFY